MLVKILILFVSLWALSNAQIFVPPNFQDVISFINNHRFVNRSFLNSQLQKRRHLNLDLTESFAKLSTTSSSLFPHQSHLQLPNITVGCMNQIGQLASGLKNQSEWALKG